MARKTAKTTLLLLTLIAGFVNEAAAANMYRYINDRGQKVYGSTVPPEFAKNGYEVINERGIVIQVVPRALTPAELAEQEATRAQREAEEAAARAAQEADNLLLRLYRSPEEVARKRDERLMLIDGQLIALLASQQKLEAEVATLQKRIDTETAGGREAPAQTVETLRIQQDELSRMMMLHARLSSDRATAVADAERDMKRLAELLGLPEDSVAE